MHNAEKPNPPASVRDTWGQGGLSASSNTRARNSLRAVALQSAPSGGVHGEGVRKYISFNALRLRFRLVASDFPGIICILNGDRSGAVELGEPFAGLIRSCRPPQPLLRVGIAGHSPVAARREADGADLGTVGNAGALVLLAEEPREEGPHRALDKPPRIGLGERGKVAQEEDLLGRVTAADGVKENEIVQLVGAERRFGGLLD